MKISIITVSYNSEKTIEDTIKSVFNQQFVDLEYIIIDGGSKDNTMEIVNKYKDKITKVISESDRGIYDAMNKGIALATGEVVGIINSDDFFHHKTVLQEVEKKFENSNVDGVYGNISYVDRFDVCKEVRFWYAGEYNENKLKRGWIMPHPAFFVKKKVYNDFGLFNLDFKIAADYELMLRFLKNNLQIKYLNKTLVCMREGGYSAKNIKQRISGWKELYQAWRVNNLKPPRWLFLTRPLFKIHQYWLKNKE